MWSWCFVVKPGDFPYIEGVGLVAGLPALHKNGLSNNRDFLNGDIKEFTSLMKHFSST